MKISQKKFNPQFLNKSYVLGIVGIATILVFPFVYEKAPVRIDFSMESSLPYSAWITTANFDNNQDRYVMFTPPVKNVYTIKAKHLIKNVSCREGDLLNVIGRDYYCNGEKIATALPTDHRGHKVENFIFNGVIPSGNYFVTGTHPRSYDSRYFGFVSTENIERGASPLW